MAKLKVFWIRVYLNKSVGEEIKQSMLSNLTITEIGS